MAGGRPRAGGCSWSAPEGTGLLGLPEPPADLAARVRREDARRFDGIFPIDVVVWGPR